MKREKRRPVYPTLLAGRSSNRMRSCMSRHYEMLRVNVALTEMCTASSSRPFGHRSAGAQYCNQIVQIFYVIDWTKFIFLLHLNLSLLQNEHVAMCTVTKCTFYNVHSYSVHMLQCTHVTTKLPITYPASMYHWTHLNRPSPPYTWRWHHVHPQFCFVAWTPMLPFHKPDRFSITAL